MTPLEALSLARRFARMRSPARSCSDLVDDVAAGALLRLFADDLPLTPCSIATSVRREAWRLDARHRAERKLIGRWWRLDGALEVEAAERAAFSAPLELERSPREHEVLRRRFSDGSLAVLPTSEACLADLSSLEILRRDGTTLHEREALQWAQASLLRERRRGDRPQQASNAARACSALVRDSALLAVATLPWREALARLAAQGVVVSREGLRSGLRAARLRCAGKSAHDSSTS